MIETVVSLFASVRLTAHGIHAVAHVEDQMESLVNLIWLPFLRDS